MKHILIAIIITLSIISFGCSNKQDTKNQEAAKAKNSLISFFSYLKEGNYEKALNLFEPENGRDRLGDFSLQEDRNNKSKILQNYCNATNTCLEIQVLETKKETNDTYNFLVQFTTKDNDVFVLGPCCGASEQEMPSKDKFNFKVKKIDNLFKVITPPIYVP